MSDLSREEIRAQIGQARVVFWVCIRRDHRQVEWRGDVAHCLTPGCGITSEDTAPWFALQREAVAKVEAERDALKAEVERLKAERDSAPRQALLAFADRLDGEIINDQDGCVQFARDVAEECPGGIYSGEPEWRTENREMADLLHRVAVARRGECPDVDLEPEELPGEIEAMHVHERRQAERLDVLKAAVLDAGHHYGCGITGIGDPELCTCPWRLAAGLGPTGEATS